MAEIKSEKDKTPKRLYRSQSDKVIGGVASGIAKYFDLDVIIVRVLFIFAVLIGGLGVPAYIIGWIIIPKEDSAEETTKERSNQSALIWGALFVILGFVILGRQFYWWDLDDFYYNWHWHPWSFWSFNFDFFIPLVLILAGIYYIVKTRKDKQDGDEISKQKSGENKMEKKLTRSVDDKMIAGVCGGLAKYLNMDPSIVRIAYALLTIGSGFFTGVIVYAVMIFVVPEEGDEQKTEVNQTQEKAAGASNPAKSSSTKSTSGRSKAKAKTTAKKSSPPKEDDSSESK